MKKTSRRIQNQRYILRLVVGLALVITGGCGLIAHHVNALASTSIPNVQTIARANNLLDTGQWSFLPGSTVEKNGLRINDRQFAIVQQDGSGGQPNPPVNLYGTRLNVKGNFVTTATAKQMTGATSFRLYGNVPVVQDEFRVESPSIELLLKDTTLTINMWQQVKEGDSVNGQPTFTKKYTVPAANEATFSVEHRGKQLIIGLNGKTVASVGDKNIFKLGQVWYGASAIGGNYLLTTVTANGVNGGTVKTQDTSGAVITPSAKTASLNSLATSKRPGFLVGAAMALAPAVSNGAYANTAFGGNFSSMTTENALKWQFVEPQKDVYDFHEGDALVQLATRNHLVVHGHTLVFGEANPAWVTNLPTKTNADKTAVQKVMTDHITAVASHYKGKISSWDVVNEPLADYDTFDTNNIYRNNKWYQSQGAGYIATAFQTAHQADPSAQLFMNEYGLEAKGDRWNEFLKLVTKLKQAGVPINGVGFEAHVYEAGDKIDPAVLQSHIRQLAKIGLVSRVSEMDVYDDDGTAVQVAQFKAVFNACLSEPSCVSWSTWGVTDKYDMYQDNGKLGYGNDLLWDSKVSPTQGLSALLTSLHS